MIHKFSIDRILDIDFETRSEANILDVGSRVYAEHPSTEIMMMSFSINGVKVVNWNPFTSKDKQPYLVLALVKAGWMIAAHHSEFEFWIWNIVGTRQFGWPKLPIEQFYDTMALSCAMAFPASLDGAGQALKAETTKDKGGTALINFFSKPSRKKGEHFKNPLHYIDKFNDFISYCDDDVACQIGIRKKTKMLSEFEHKVFILTEKMNERGLPIDEELCRGALDLVDEYQIIANKKAIKIAGKDCPFESLTQAQAVKKWLNENGCDIPNMQKDVIADWLTNPKKKMSKKARKILELRSQVAMSSTSKYKKILAQLASDGCVHGFIKYYIARTGRWGGRGVQIQNFPRPVKEFIAKMCEIQGVEFDDLDWEQPIQMIKDRDIDQLEWYYDDVMSVLSSCLRAAIKAPDGYKFVSADYSQVEARFVMWFANDPQGLKEFGGEGKIYEGMASQIYNIPKKKIGKNSFERFMGKQTILGAGFGMAAPKFVTSCKEKGGVDVELDLAKKAIYGYRDRYSMVPKLWTEVEKCAIRAVKMPGTIHKYIHVKYQMRGKHLYCILPSGRELCYPFAFVKYEKTKFGMQSKLYYQGLTYERKWGNVDTWGGKLTENFVQAAARDVMAHGLINCEEAGYLSLFTVHDEGVSMVKKDFGSYQEYEKLMCDLPAWAIGCPIEAEGWEGERYRK